MTELLAERDFVALAHARMAALESGTLSTAQSAGNFQDIMTSAQSVKAKAVMICARQCRDYCLANQEANTPDGATLNHLIVQYANGLYEIDPGARGAVDPESAANPLSLKDSVDLTPSQFQTAANTLSPLIKFAPSDNQRALRSLIALSGADLDVSPPRMSADRPTRLVSLESLVSPISSGALIAAHIAYKQVSLSYACDDILIHGDLEDSLQSVLNAACEALIAHSVRLPKTREAAGLSGTAQISLTASDTQNGLMLDIFCDDLPLPPKALTHGPLSIAMQSFSKSGGRMTLSPRRQTGVMLSVTHPSPRLTDKPAQQPIKSRGGDVHEAAIHAREAIR